MKVIFEIEGYTILQYFDKSAFTEPLSDLLGTLYRVEHWLRNTDLH